MSPAEKYAHQAMALRRAERAVLLAKQDLADAARSLRSDAGVSLPHSVLVGGGVCVTITKDLDYSLRDSNGHMTEIPLVLVGGIEIG